jgi:DHA1 family tetracycline resistance protein-like MFS transporter
MSSNNFFSLIIISFIGFIDLVGVGLVYPMFSSMLYQENCIFLSDTISDTMRGACLGVLLATMPLTQFFSAPLLGMLSDRRGRKPIIEFGLLVGFVGYLIAISAVSLGSLPLLLLSRVAIGISAGTVSVVNAAVADISSSADKAKNFGILNMAMGLGFTVGPLLGGFLSELDLGFIRGYSVAFLGAALMTLTNLVLVLGYFKESYTPSNAVACSLVQGVVNIRKAFLSRELRAVFACVFCSCVGWSFYWEFAPVTWIVEYNFDQPTIGYCYAYGALAYALSCGFLIRPIVSRFANECVLFYALIGCAVSIGLLMLHSSPWWLWIYIPLQQYFIALFWPTAAATVSNASSEAKQGEALGIFASVESLAFALSPLIAGPLLGISIAMPILLGSGMVLLAAVVLRGAASERLPLQEKR